MASTPTTASEPEPSPGRYRFDFAWESPYGHAVELLKRLSAKPGVVIDLGCGFGSVAEVLADEGFEYVGADVDGDALADLSSRGFETHRVDLRQVERLPEALESVAAGRRVAGVLLLDVIEHLPETQPFLRAVRAGMEGFGRASLVVSVPNVAHSDIAAKLVFGRWDRTPTGLLDTTHLQLFTAAGLTDALSQGGFLEVAEHDFRLARSDQHFPADHPALAPTSPVAQLLRGWREAAGPHATTNQFVRAFVMHDAEPAAPEAAAAARFLSVVMRTQGRRPTNLREALTCLAAQTDDSFGVLLMVHSEDPDMVVGVREIVGEFDSSFSSRVSVIPVAGGGRGRPLNAALDVADGAYVAFLDDDDLVTGNWVEEFAANAAGGAVVRSGCVIRRVSQAPADSTAPYLLESGLEACFEARFNLSRHFWNNQTPICSFAVPRTLLATFGLRFDEDLPVVEDWDFLMRCVTLASVRDSGEITSIYHRWTNSESSASLHDATLWAAVHQVVLERLDNQPLLFPRHSASSLAAVWQTLAEVRLQLHEARMEGIELRGQLAHVTGERDWLRGRYDMVIHSRRWRLLARPARAIAELRRRVRLRPRQ